MSGFVRFGGLRVNRSKLEAGCFNDVLSVVHMGWVVYVWLVVLAMFQ